MAEYAITFARSARKQLQVLDRAHALRILERIEALTVAPRPANATRGNIDVGLEVAVV